jgi:hypothetical protein
MTPKALLVAILLSINLFSPGAASGAENLQKIRIGLPSLALTYMRFLRGSEKSLTKESRSRSGIHPNEHRHPARNSPADIWISCARKTARSGVLKNYPRSAIKIGCPFSYTRNIFH